MLKDEQYKRAMYGDLIFCLMNLILKNKKNKKELAQKIFNTWKKRNEKLTHKNLQSQTKRLISLSKEFSEREDEISIIVSTHELVFNSIREEIMEHLKFVVVDSYEDN